MSKTQAPFRAFVYSLLFVACTANNMPSDINGLILLSQCANACWAGIEPGITVKEQALSILINKYGSENVTSEDFNNQTHAIYWTANQQDWSDKGTVTLIDDRVVDIYIGLERKIIVSDFITSIGEPSFVNGVIGAITSSSAEYRCAGITLIYPEIGLQVYPSLYEDSLGIYESQHITFLIIRKSWKQDEIPWTDSFNIPWDGYREYCQMP